jgi:hypothetical protein
MSCAPSDVHVHSKLGVAFACVYVAGLAPCHYFTLVHVVCGELYWYSFTYFAFVEVEAMLV